MRKIREVIVVEGRYDKNALKQVVEATVVETGGFGVFKDKERLALLRRLARERGLILLTDSDGAGFVIRNFLKGAIPKEQIKQAYIPDIYGKERRKAAPGKEGKLGVEGMRPEVLIAALERAGATFEDGETSGTERTPITKGDLYELGLSGRPDSAQRRAELLRKLGLPEHMTANALLETLNILYSREELLGRKRMDRTELAALFDGWEETMVWSCLQGVMGRMEGNADGTAARITSGDFCFLAGKPDLALVEGIAAPIVTARTPDWHPLIEKVYGQRAIPATRYAIKKEPDIFDRAKLMALAAPPEGCELRLMDEAMVPTLLGEDWSRDFCSSFESPADFARRGLGVVALRKGIPVAGAASYIVYHGGIEIEIDTRKDHRNRGLATACGARLILECLDRGLYPSWDAHDLRSVHLAEKLGYHLAGPYPVYFIEKALAAE